MPAELLKYSAVALGTVLDHSGLPLPLLAATAGAPALHMTPWLIVAVAAAGAFLGDVLLYEVGRRVGRETLLAGRLAKRLGRLPGAAIDAVAARPRAALVLYRYLPGIGKYAPLASGAAVYPRTQALALCALGCMLYCCVFGVLGLLLQPAAVELLAGSRRAWGIAAVVATCLLVFALYRRRQKRAYEEHARTPASSETTSPPAPPTRKP